MIPFAGADFDPELWPISMSELTPYVHTIEELFGLPNGAYELPEFFGASSTHVARSAKWPHFRARNVYSLVAGEVEALSGPEIWINATASTFKIEDGELTQITAVAIDSSRLTVRAKQIIIAAGAIESTRLLLLLNQQNNNVITRKTSWLGRNFLDHLSTVIARVQVKDRAALNRLVGFRFDSRRTMRNIRFELNAGSELRKTLPACFAHVAFAADEVSGFAELRDLFRSLQRRERVGIGQLVRLALQFPWLARAVYWRLMEKRLLYPGNASIELHMVIDQQPSENNRIELSTTRKDPFGQPLARINWCITNADKANMSAATDEIIRVWADSPLANVASLKRLSDEEIWRSMELGGGIYHPCGSTRMANHADKGVVDSHLRVFQIPNTRVVSTSVMPTGGGANPTMTLLLLAARCVDDITTKASQTI